MDDHYKNVKALYQMAYRTKHKRCCYCLWCGNRTVEYGNELWLWVEYSIDYAHCNLKERDVCHFQRIRAHLCKYYKPQI